jgi:hypothetical protein
MIEVIRRMALVFATVTVFSLRTKEGARMADSMEIAIKTRNRVSRDFY